MSARLSALSACGRFNRMMPTRPLASTMMFSKAMVFLLAQLDASALDNLFPLREIGFDDGGIILWRAGRRILTDQLESFNHQRRFQRVVNGAVEPVDDRARRLRRRDNAEPRHRHVTRNASLGDGWEVGEAWRARRATDAKGANSVVAHERRHRCQSLEHDVDAAGDNIIYGASAAAIRHMGNLGAGETFKQLEADMPGRAIGGRSSGQLAGVRLGIVDQF